MREAFFSPAIFLGSGAVLMLIGFFFAYLPSLLKGQIAERKTQAERLRHDGHHVDADRLNDKTKAFVLRIPQCGVAMIAIGAFLMAAAVYL